MSTESPTVETEIAPTTPSLRADRPDSPWLSRVRAWAPAVRVLLVVALAVGFVVIGGAKLDLGPIEAKLGMAAGVPFGPLGQLYGGWEPSLWPVPVALSRAWTWALCEGGTPSPAAVRWPSAIAGVLAGFILTRRVNGVLGARASILTGLCWFGSIALMDRSAGAGLDLIMGLGTIAALDRIIGHRSDLVAGSWASLAFLAGGWPPLALIALTTVVIGRREAGLSAKLLIPPLLAAVAWSAWALSQVQAEAWAAALALPLTMKSSWFLAVSVLALGLPWSPLAALAASRSVRGGWSEPGRAVVVGWLQAAAACLVVGTVVPGLAAAARMPALAGLAVVAAACGESLWAESTSNAARRGFLALTATIIAVWGAITIIGGVFLASAVPYYRFTAIVLIGLTLLIALVGLVALRRGDARRGLVAFAVIAICVKIAHCGYYVPEWNYRRSQGPWGRAIGQWLVPRWTIYTLHTWPTDLAFATEHPVRQLRHPRSLAFQDGPTPRFVLLLAPEFEHWPDDAPPLVKVASFQDEYGSTRVLARTAGEFSWRALAEGKTEAEKQRR